MNIRTQSALKQFLQTSFIVALGFRPAALAEDQPWEAVVRECDSLRNQTRLAEAERVCSQALRLAEKSEPQDKRLAISQGRLALVYHKLGRLSEAESLYHQMVEA